MNSAVINTVKKYFKKKKVIKRNLEILSKKKNASNLMNYSKIKGKCQDLSCCWTTGL